jgi:hypothetical protein
MELLKKTFICIYTSTHKQQISSPIITSEVKLQIRSLEMGSQYHLCWWRSLCTKINSKDCIKNNSNLTLNIFPCIVLYFTKNNSIFYQSSFHALFFYLFFLLHKKKNEKPKNSSNSVKPRRKTPFKKHLLQYFQISRVKPH